MEHPRNAQAVNQVKQADQTVQLNHEHSDYRWMTFDEAKQHAALPGIDDILGFVEKHFARKVPSKWLRINREND